MAHRAPKPATLLAARMMASAPASYPYTVAQDAEEIVRASGVLHRINERQCNGYRNDRTFAHDDAAESRDLLREMKMRARVTIIAQAYGFRPRFQTDPRGCAIYLQHKETVEREGLHMGEFSVASE